ncbi:hypothetical protein CEXT_389771 [Caerostris extrusa]|uniref:Uncharacterized protein n=1 Tax=Caerostris extrusa TaxID=172846 RepID=A0AAV4VAS6_CAEEX|nr:hypothetical protein CEXT_389771 [Caerostris extrusa]
MNVASVCCHLDAMSSRVRNSFRPLHVKCRIDLFNVKCTRLGVMRWEEKTLHDSAIGISRQLLLCGTSHSYPGGKIKTNTNVFNPTQQHRGIIKKKKSSNLRNSFRPLHVKCRIDCSMSTWCTRLGMTRWEEKTCTCGSFGVVSSSHACLNAVPQLTKSLNNLSVFLLKNCSCAEHHILIQKQRLRPIRISLIQYKQQQHWRIKKRALVSGILSGHCMSSAGSIVQCQHGALV